MTFKRIACSVVSAGTFLVTASSAIYASDVTISGNGAHSTNTVWTSTSCTSSVSQTNTMNVVTGVNSSANSGENSASHNTGGDVAISTGDASSVVSVTVVGGGNEATAPNCCACTNNVTDLSIMDNGAKSRNKVKQSLTTTTLSSQKSKTNTTTSVNSKAKTGKNKVNGNTGSGSSIEVLTGASESSVEVGVVGGSNSL